MTQATARATSGLAPVSRQHITLEMPVSVWRKDQPAAWYPHPPEEAFESVRMMNRIIRRSEQTRILYDDFAMRYDIKRHRLILEYRPHTGHQWHSVERYIHEVLRGIMQEGGSPSSPSMLAILEGLAHRRAWVRAEDLGLKGSERLEYITQGSSYRAGLYRLASQSRDLLHPLGHKQRMWIDLLEVEVDPTVLRGQIEAAIRSFNEGEEPSQYWPPAVEMFNLMTFITEDSRRRAGQ